MSTPNLLVVCSIAFLAVFVVLTALAAVMRGLMLLYPQPAEREESLDPAVVAAITEAVTAAYPGTKVIGIEEER